MIFFAEPKQLPSIRALNHIIPLIPRSKAININLIRALIYTKEK